MDSIMKRLCNPDSALTQAVFGGIMAGTWMVFAFINVSAFAASGRWSYLVFCIAETVTAAIFLVRTMPRSVSPHPGDWLIAFAGTFAPMLFLPATTALLPEAGVLVLAGTLFQFTGLLSLNRSLGMVPATRVIKTGGLYRLIRHPLYAGYLINFTGYLLLNTSWRNLVVYLAAAALLLARIVREEAHLSVEDEYRLYMGRVKYRVLPFVF